ncbi:redoxin domain-containing protein [Neolewinella aurantiaca]|uniref:Redoxin domain-containing protein n=1 Tax=Neolewinella aurantiaca TaxID=2602767 RepID=A0A5C7FL34_9BACT|nr:TlpA family protein disulfide reductase [Neolewinella aurantiaca]TXF90743.1 redoxin domain-containing protein [Neolewinella aurantiaca]
MRKYYLFLFMALTFGLSAQESYKITIEIDGYEEPILSLANNVLDKQYIVDTAARSPEGTYVFESDTSALPRGIYLVVLAPDNSYFQMVVGDDDDQVFTLKTRKDKLAGATVESSEENEIFFEYLAYLDRQGEASRPAREALQDSTLTDEQRDPLMEKLNAISDEVDLHQQKIMAEYPQSFTTAIIKANRANDPPAYEHLAEEERNPARLAWLLEHYFDPLDLKDDRLLRTPFLFERINYYVDRLHIQHPDTVAMAIDKVLGKMDPNSELFKYYVVHFTNKAAKSKIVGMDAVYVHMVDAYYKSGLAYWVDPEQLETMTEDVERIRPLLIGRKAPNLAMSRRDGSPVELYDIDAKYTVLYFWKYDCSSCKKSTPYMKDFYAKWKDRGVEVFSVCTKQNELEKCWEYIDDNEIGDWLHATDRYQRFFKDYDVRSTPTIYVLDENKEIVSKRIAAKQLDELLENLEKQRELREESDKSTGER